MKIVCEWMVLAERVILDAHTGNFTLVSCLEQVASIQFPATHYGFAVAARFRCVGDLPAETRKTQYRLTRLCETDAPEVIGEFAGSWAAGTSSAKFASNFHMLRLKRPEVVTFRLDHRVDGQRWVTGPSCSIEVRRLELPPEQLEALRADAARLGVPLPE